MTEPIEIIHGAWDPDQQPAHCQDCMSRTTYVINDGHCTVLISHAPGCPFFALHQQATTTEEKK